MRNRKCTCEIDNISHIDIKTSVYLWCLATSLSKIYKASDANGVATMDKSKK